MRLFIFLFFIFFSMLGHSEKIVIGVEKLNYLPYYTHNNNQYKGYARELFDRFGQDKEHTIHYKILPVSRLFHEFMNAQVDFKFPDNPHWKSQDKKDYDIQYSTPVVDFTDGIMVTPESLTKDEALFTRIGTMRGFTPWILKDKITNNKMTLFENNTISGLLKQVQLQRTDGCFVNIDVARYFLEKELNQTDSLILNFKLPHAKGSYYLATIKHKDILNQFNEWLQENEKFHKELKIKWGL